MSRDINAPGRAAAGVVWSLAGLVLCVGWYVLDARYERAIAIANSASETLYRNAVRNEALLRRTSTLRRARQSVLQELSRYASAPLKSDSAVALVDTLAKCATALRVQIVGLQPADQAVKNTTGHQPGTQANGLSGDAHTLTVRGRFPDIVRFVQRLSRQRMPIEVQNVQISRVNTFRGTPLVEGTIDIVAFRLVVPKAADATAN